MFEFILEFVFEFMFELLGAEFIFEFGRAFELSEEFVIDVDGAVVAAGLGVPALEFVT